MSDSPQAKRLINDLYELLFEAHRKGRRVVSVKALHRLVSEYAEAIPKEETR